MVLREVLGLVLGTPRLKYLVAVLEKMGYSTGIDLYKILDASDVAESELVKEIPRIKSLSIISGLSGVFSGFSKPVERISKEYDVDARDVFFELGRRQVVAGQEDLIIEVVSKFSFEKQRERCMIHTQKEIIQDDCNRVTSESYFPVRCSKK